MVTGNANGGATGALQDEPGVVIPILDDELDDFETEAGAYRAQQREEVEFMLYRLRQGVYGQRQPDVHMNRVKLPMGGVTAEQLDGFGEIAENFAPLKKGHITTRQNMQIHFVPLDLMPDMLRVLGRVGLSSREACGNTVRNVTADPWAGILPGEVFDPTPYAGAFVRYWVRNAITQLLPRKFKVYFTGRKTDSAIAAIHDLAFFAEVREIDGEEVRGFRVMVGGGLSTMAKEALLLTEFVPVSEFLRLSEAVIRVFNAADELRKNILKARIKFLVHRVGEAAFQEMVAAELQKPWAEYNPPVDELLYHDDEAGRRAAAAADLGGAERRPRGVRAVCRGQRDAAAPVGILDGRSQHSAGRYLAGTVLRSGADSAHLRPRPRADHAAAEPGAALDSQRERLRRLEGARRAGARRSRRAGDRRRGLLPRHRLLQARDHLLDGAQPSSPGAAPRARDRGPADAQDARAHERLPELLRPAPHRRHRLPRRSDQSRQSADSRISHVHRRHLSQRRDAAGQAGPEGADPGQARARRGRAGDRALRG